MEVTQKPTQTGSYMKLTANVNLAPQLRNYGCSFSTSTAQACAQYAKTYCKKVNEPLALNSMAKEIYYHTDFNDFSCHVLF
jgi:hypothetical protein